MKLNSSTFYMNQNKKEKLTIERRMNFKYEILKFVLKLKY